MRFNRPDVPLCRHTKTDGHLCQSPALRTSAFCHYHQKLRRTRPRTLTAGPGLSPNVLYPLRRAESIHDALSMVFTGLASGKIDPKLGGKMVRALRLASEDLRRSLGE
jgi:hypothetical protein